MLRTHSPVTYFAMTAALRRTLTARREGAGISLRQLGRLDTGVDVSNLSRFEHGATPKDLDLLVCTYADALGVTPAVLWRDALRACERDPEGSLATAAAVGRRARAIPLPVDP